MYVCLKMCIRAETIAQFGRYLPCRCYRSHAMLHNNEHDDKHDDELELMKLTWMLNIANAELQIRFLDDHMWGDRLQYKNYQIVQPWRQNCENDRDHLETSIKKSKEELRKLLKEREAELPYLAGQTIAPMYSI